MNPQLSLSPFGQRPLSLAMMARQAEVEAFEGEELVHKWAVYRAICEAKAAIGASDRALAVLHALLSFHPDTTLSAGEVVVFPSNRELSLRAHGMAPATLRRHLAQLVDCGLIVRRDSPNGKRYARKGSDGDIDRAFGFDLSPLVVRAAEFTALAEKARAERQALILLREEVSIYRRDISKMIAMGIEEGVEAPWEEFHSRFIADIGEDVARHITREAQEQRPTPCEPYAKMSARPSNIIKNPENMSAKESQSERLYLNSNTETQNESEPAIEERRAAPHPLSSQPAPAPAVYPLMMVLKACPDIADYTRSGIGSWSDLMDAAQLVRPMLGISPSAFDAASKALGPQNTAVTIAAILQKGSAIRSPGGYLRVLTRKAETGNFSLGPILMALLKQNVQGGISVGPP